VPHLRAPAISRGVVAFIWALVFGLYIWLGGVAIGMNGAIAFVLAVVCGFAIFVFVRTYGEDAPRHPRAGL